jgi:sugar/nucleoside kinase (ribokinase family)
MLFGASAFFTRIECPKIPEASEETGCRVPIRYPDGPSVKLALALAQKGYQVVFSSSVGNDQDGWNLISELVRNGVDVSKILIEPDRSTNQTIIIDVDGFQGVMVGIGDQSALSLSSPSQVSWDTAQQAKVIYLGEVFLEVAVSVAVFAQSSNIPVLYRCSPHYWKLGLQELTPLLSQIDILLLSPKEWFEAKRFLGAWPFNTLRTITTAAIIAKVDERTYKISLDGTSEYSTIQSKKESDDLTVSFTSELLKAISEGRAVAEAFDAALEYENRQSMES